MLEPKPQFIINKIVRSIVLACKEDINKLTDVAYSWLHIKSGFIAHYNRTGFIGHYGSGFMLRQAILDNSSRNSVTNYYKGEQDYPYYKQQADTYELICKYLTGRKRKLPNEKDCKALYNSGQIR